MTVWTNNAEGGTQGATVTTGNSGGASGTAPSIVEIGSSAALTFDNAHAFGTRSYKMFSGGGTAEDFHTHMWWSVPSTTFGYGRTYLWLNAWPTGDSMTFAICLRGEDRTFALSVSTSGKLEIRDTNNSVVARSSGSLATGQQVRVEWFCRTTSGKRVEARFYNSASAPVGSYSGNVFSTTLATTSTMNYVTYGAASYENPITIWQDGLGYSTDGWMGPAQKIVSVGQAVETDVAQQVGLGAYPTGQAVETDTAFEVRPGRAFPVPQGSETDLAQPIAVQKQAKIPQAIEQDVAQQITPFLYGPGWNPKVIEIRLFDDAGNQTKFTPDWTKIDFTSLFSAEGVVTVEYPPEGLNYTDLTTPDTEGALFLNNVEVDGSRFIISEKSGDVVKPDATAQIQGKTWVTRLDEILVYPPAWPDTTTKDYTFTNATVGQIMSTLLLAGQDRSVDAATKTTWTFTNGADSNGNAWAKQATITFKAGTNLLDVLKNLTKLGMCDFTTKGRELWITNATELGTDRTGGTNPVVLFKGRDFSDAPVNWSTQDLISTCLVEGDGGVLVEVVDSAAVTEWARREGYASQSGISDETTLGIVGQSTIDINDHKREERSHELTFDTSGFLALYDYFVGDMVAVDTEGTQSFYRVMQIRISWSDKGDQTGGVTLNDRFEDLAVKLQQQIDGFSGVVVTNAPGPGPDPDTTIPKAPTSLTASSSVYVGGNGAPIVQFVASWAAVTQNTDNSPITDLDRYEVQEKPTASAFWGPAQSSDTATDLYMYGFTSGTSYDFRVRAVDTNENKSAWSSTYTSVAVYDTTPPSTPSTPTVIPYLGTLKVIWNGLDNVGAVMPPDFRNVQVHVSTVNNFTPTSSTVVDYLPAAGTSVISGLTYGTMYYVKLVAADTSGNLSTASTQATGIPTQVVSTDIGGNVIGLDNVQFKDTTNHVPDGSFETAERRAAVLAGQNTSIWSFVSTGAGHGTYALRGNAAVSPSTTRLIPLTPNGSTAVELPVPPSTNLYCRMMYKGDTTPTGGVGLRIVWRNAAGTTTNADVLTGTVGTGTWTVVDGQVTSPSDAVTYSVWLFINSTATSGFWYFDRVEVRDVIDSIIVKDGAITTAKIANLAVNDAKIGSVAAGKITTGTLAADIVVGARIKTADTGARVELNSTGLKAYNSSGTQTVSIASSDGSVDLVGRFRSGFGGTNPYIEITTSAAGGTIAFWAPDSSEKATISTTGFAGSIEVRSTVDGSTGQGSSLVVAPNMVQIYGGNATSPDLSGYLANYENTFFSETLNNTSGDTVWTLQAFRDPASNDGNQWSITARNNALTLLNEISFFGSLFEVRGRIQQQVVDSDQCLVVGQTEFSTSAGGFTQGFSTSMASEPLLTVTLEDDPPKWCGLQSITGSQLVVGFSANTVGFSQTFWMGWRE